MTGTTETSRRGRGLPMATPEDLFERDGVFGVLVLLDGAESDHMLAISGVATRLRYALNLARDLGEHRVHIHAGGWSARVERFDAHGATVAVVFEANHPVHKSIPRSLLRIARKARAAQETSRA